MKTLPYFHMIHKVTYIDASVPLFDCWICWTVDGAGLEIARPKYLAARDCAQCGGTYCEEHMESCGLCLDCCAEYNDLGTYQ